MQHGLVGPSRHSYDRESGTILAKRMCGDAIASVCAAFSVSPVVSAMDRAITKNTSGAQKLWPALASGLHDLAKRPLANIGSTPTLWLVLVYSCTFGGANFARTVCEWLRVSPGMPVLFASTAGNMTGIAKDRAFARMYGITEARPMPFRAYSIFFVRDLMAMGFIFSLPPIVSRASSAAFALHTAAQPHTLDTVCTCQGAALAYTRRGASTPRRT